MAMSAGQSVPNATRSTPTVSISILRAGRFLGASRPEKIVLPTTRKGQAGRSRAGGCKPFLAYRERSACRRSQAGFGPQSRQLKGGRS